ncbi:MAG: HAMP domain-containing sensor histidine kinase [Bacteroidales bacterium]|jgi:signal transduction histidine kinase|nr:HAMP domain-containing sensor histidine kinase [Bacteroidales bacterium]
MTKQGLINQILDNWHLEFKLSIAESPSIYLALFSETGDLIFANKTLKKTFISKLSPKDNFLNPSFSKILKTQPKDSLIYSGYITLGSYDTENISLLGKIYRKGSEILFIGGVDSGQLLEQNKLLFNLNNEINTLQRELTREKAMLEEANATKDKFFSIIAHDLKNPFNALLGFSDYLLENFREMEQEEVEEQLEMLSNTSRQTFSLLEDLLTWSKTQRGKIDCKPEKINIQFICNEIRGAVGTMAKEKDINLQYVAEDNLELYADPNMLKTILRNLVSNAIKFSYRGKDVVVTFINMGKFTKTTVSDSGTGISAVNQGRLWNLAGQYTTRGTEEESGTGLGLLICKEFVEAHGGKIWVESEENKGSNFIFTLPSKI